MKAIRKHDTYMGYKWRRDKNTKIAFIGREDELTINDTIYYGTEIETGHWIIPNENGNYIYIKPNEDYSDVKLSLTRLEAMMNISLQDLSIMKGYITGEAHHK